MKRATKLTLLIGGASVLLAAGLGIVYKGYPQLWYNWFRAKLWDSETEEMIKSLHPKIRGQARAFLKEAELMGYKLRVYSAFRSFLEQGQLYAQGRTDPGSIVTNAEPGESYHNYGLAFDVVEIKDGEALWNNPNLKEIVAIAKKYGFEWGGNFKGLKDTPHFQKTFGYSVSELFTKLAPNSNQYVNI